MTTSESRSVCGRKLMDGVMVRSFIVGAKATFAPSFRAIENGSGTSAWGGAGGRCLSKDLGPYRHLIYRRLDATTLSRTRSSCGQAAHSSDMRGRLRRAPTTSKRPHPSRERGQGRCPCDVCDGAEANMATRLVLAKEGGGGALWSKAWHVSNRSRRVRRPRARFGQDLTSYNLCPMRSSPRCSSLPL